MLEQLLQATIFLGVMALGAAIIFARTERRRSLGPRFQTAGVTEVPFTPGGESTFGRLLAGVGRLANLGATSQRLRDQLARAGHYSEHAATAYLGSKFLLLALGALSAIPAVVFFELPLAALGYLVLACATTCFFIPNVVLRIQQTKRITEIRNQLPNAVDLLEVCVSAGMGLDMAWTSVSDEIRAVSSTLGDEMALVNLEVRLGASRTEAMQNMARRTGAHELSSLVALLVQTERFGTSIADALRTFASSMRETRSVYAEESAEKMSVKLLFPLVFFIFPVIMIVVAGPAGITLVSILNNE